MGSVSTHVGFMLIMFLKKHAYYLNLNSLNVSLPCKNWSGEGEEGRELSVWVEQVWFVCFFCI